VTKERELEQMKDDLLSTVSHELRTPLFSIRGFVHLLLDDDPPPPETQRDFLQIIAREANQLANMVTNLLDSNKISSGEVEVTKEPLQLGDIIRRTCQKLQGYALNEAVTPSLDVPPNLPLILGNAQQLEQVFTNIIGNAIKFTPQNGSISITCEVVGTRYIIARIADTGIGISETDLEHIFSRFYQVDHNADAQQPGSGLGLHIARQLVEQHSGQIWTESQPGQGSTFFIKLPILN
jgi:signal transduction histidine kinase